MKELVGLGKALFICLIIALNLITVESFLLFVYTSTEPGIAAHIKLVTSFVRMSLSHTNLSAGFAIKCLRSEWTTEFPHKIWMVTLINV